MAADFILRHFFGFALQIVPATLLLLLPFDRSKFRLTPRKTWLLFAGVDLSLCGIYALSIYEANISRPDSDGAGFLFGNLFLCASIIIITCLYYLLIDEKAMRKAFLFFSVVTFAVIQYSLVTVLLIYTPVLPASQRGQSYDINTCIAYLVVTLLILPPTAVFFRKTMRIYLNRMSAGYSRVEFIILIVVTLLFLVLNALLSMFWTQYQETKYSNQVYYVPVTLLLTAMLFIVYYSVIRLSNLRAEENERKLESVIIRADHDRIQQDMEEQRKRLHDTRQLLNNLAVIAKNGSRDELMSYINETVSHVRLPDTRYCADSRMNGILQYYAATANSMEIPFSVQARCADLSAVSETDLTVLLGNALENALRSAQSWQTKHASGQNEIKFNADDGQNMLRIQIENKCDQVLYAPSVKTSDHIQYLPAESFLSTTGSGQGLNRIAAIASKYEGMAEFRFDGENQTFITRIVLML